MSPAFRRSLIIGVIEYVIFTTAILIIVRPDTDNASYGIGYYLVSFAFGALSTGFYANRAKMEWSWLKHIVIQTIVTILWIALALNGRSQ